MLRSKRRILSFLDGMDNSSCLINLSKIDFSELAVFGLFIAQCNSLYEKNSLCQTFSLNDPGMVMSRPDPRAIGCQPGTNVIRSSTALKHALMSVIFLGIFDKGWCCPSELIGDSSFVTRESVSSSRTRFLMSLAGLAAVCLCLLHLFFLGVLLLQSSVFESWFVLQPPLLLFS